MLKIVIKINEILNKLKIIEHEMNARLEMIIIFVDEIIKLLNFYFHKNMFKNNFNFRSS